MTRARRFALAAALLAALGCARRLERQGYPRERVESTPLAYRNHAGESRTYALTQTLRGKIALGGMPQLVVVRLKGRLTETCELVQPDGWARVRLRYEFAPPEINGMASPLAAEGSRTEVRVLRSPAGLLRDADGGAAPVDAIAWASRVLGGVAPVLPAAPPRPGDAWTSPLVLPLAGGALTGTATGSLAGFEDAGGTRCAVLAEEGDAGLGLGTPSGALEAFRVTYRGRVRFDPAAGRLVDATREGELHFKAREGRTRIEARFRFTAAAGPVPD